MARGPSELESPARPCARVCACEKRSARRFRARRATRMFAAGRFCDRVARLSRGRESRSRALGTAGAQGTSGVVDRWCARGIAGGRRRAVLQASRCRSRVMRFRPGDWGFRAIRSITLVGSSVALHGRACSLSHRPFRCGRLDLRRTMYIRGTPCARARRRSGSAVADWGACAMCAAPRLGSRISRGARPSVG